MFLCFGVDIVAPVISLFVAKNLDADDQALGAGLLQTANQLGRSIGLAIATIVQSAAQGNVGSAGGATPGDLGLLHGLQAAQWVNVGLAVTPLVVTVIAFRGLGRS